MKTINNQILTLWKRKVFLRLSMLSLFLCLIQAQLKAQTYCTPENIYPGYSCTYGYSRIYSINLSGVNGDELSDAPACSPDHKDRTSAVPALDLAPGSTFYGSIGIHYGFMSYNIWIDFDDDGVFDSTERIAKGGYPNIAYGVSNTGTPSSSYMYTFALQIPSSAPAGTHRMRVRAAYTAMSNSANTNLDPCTKTNGTTNNYYGSSMDYLVSVSAGSACGPVFTSVAENRVVCPGSNTSFSQSASGATSLQWQVNDGSGFVNISNGTLYSGATTGTLTVTGITAALSGYKYRCIASDGSCSSAGNTALLWVNAPVLTSQPENKTALVGGGTTFSTAARAVPTYINTYQWQVNTGAGFTNLSTGGNYLSVNSSTMTIINATQAMNGYQYRCRVSNATCTVLTNEATLSVIESSIEPQFKYANEGYGFSLTIGSSNYTTQNLYTPGDFGSAPAGMIKKIYLRASMATALTSTISNLEINIGSSTITTLTTLETGLTNVFSASTFTIDTVLATEWIPIELQTPVYYDPTQSLIVEIIQTDVTGARIALRSGSSHVNTSYGGNMLAYKYNPSTYIGKTTILNNLGMDIDPCLEISNKPADKTVNADSGGCSATNVSLGTPTVASNCGGTVSITNNAPSVYPKGTTTVTWTVTNGTDSQTFDQSVTVVDGQAPVFSSCPSNITVTPAAGQCSAAVNYSTPTITDNCGTCSPVPDSISGYTLIGSFGGHTYFKSNAAGDWNDFDSAAIAMGGHLATIGSAAENNYLAGQGQAWIGLNDKANEGTFVWSNAEGVTYTNWCNGEPNNSNDEDYTMINWESNGCWNDGHATSYLPAIIEFDCDAQSALTLTRIAGPASGSTFSEGTTTVSYKATDASGNYAICSFTVTVNSTLSSSISVTPSNSTYTGGVPTNIYLGYGPQSATLNATATGGTGFTYSWSPATGLSCSNCQNPVFTPTAEGTYSYTVIATNSNGCETKSTVTFCVLDINAPNGNNKVYICHDGQTLSVSSSAVPAHLSNHAGDKLGGCGQSCASGKNAFVREEVMEEGENELDIHQVTVYPNPNNGQFTVEFSETFENATVVISDMNGRTIVRKIASESSMQFDLGGFPKGFYILTVQSGEEVYRTKLSVQ